MKSLMKNNYFIFINFLIFLISNISSANYRLEDFGYENLQFSTFINDCNYDTQRCNLTVYQNSILNNSFSEPIIFAQYSFLNEFINDKKPIYFLGMDEGIVVMYRSIKSLPFLDGSDVLVPSRNGYQLVTAGLRELNREFNGYDFGETNRLSVQGPYFYHCVVPEFDTDFVVNCLVIGDNNEFNVITNYYWNWYVYVLKFSQIYENYTIETNETLISNTFTAKDIFSSFYYYYTRDIKNQVYVGLTFTNSSIWGDSNSTCLVKHINEPLLNYENIIGIVGYNDSILICGNHQLNNSLIVYSYNFTNEKQSFVFSDKINITHVIQPQFSSTRYCLFFSNITNSSILFDIYQNKVILNHNHLNLNISRHLYENSSRSISYFIYPKQYIEYNFTKYSEPTLEPIKNNTQPNNYVNNENNSSTLTVSFSILTISVLLLSFIFFK
ncbi:hypothetical protein ACTFIZ_007772 [Dictyostelium cf. discoideum]